MTLASAVRPLALRQLALTVPRTPRRNARVVNAFSRFFQTRVEPRVVAKYREKLELKQKTEGVSSFEELKQVYKGKIEAVRKEAAVTPEVDAVLNATAVATTAAADAPTQARPPPPPIAAAARRAASAPPGVKTLSSYVDADALSAHTSPKEIELIWRARFVAAADSLCAVVPTATYKRMEALAKRHPMFLLPLPRDGQGVEMHLLQWTFPSRESATVIFTSLEDYKLRGEFAQPHTTLTHHLELADGHGLVLAQGQVISERGVSVDQAQLLVIALQKFYGAIESSETERRKEMLEMFTRGDEKFSIEALIAEVEKAV
ncbi:ATP11 protein-domain-containing protein [Tricharina praecox]|uniref:ATP11 protein-domain-containing protein n=1 Tax=Tricharina praecox TaxID=43433 RepID=UPI00221E600B|nr:ATP11 protein-domain-containing protein [Tricharina praecox]KAI5857769.1 ATP11 protein-domain-containing protein [Tricharina praecox]